jgi:mannose-1-phosphate guanylyltransferase/mannose-6-phosphate isomerase
VRRGTAPTVRNRVESRSESWARQSSGCIPVGTEHRIENPGSEPLQIIEIQSGSCLGEDNIVHLDDYYGCKGRTD